MLTIHPEPNPEVIDIRGGTPARWRAALDALRAVNHPSFVAGDFEKITEWAPRHLLASPEFGQALIDAGVARPA